MLEQLEVEEPRFLAGPVGLTIPLSSGVGTGPTTLAAFDAALRGAGIANFHLLALSSVIPPGSTIETGPIGHIDGEWGDRLYVVMAEARTAAPGAEVWAGIGWVQADDGRGLFVEHEGHSEAQVRDDIRDSLGAMTAGRPERFAAPQMEVRGATCDGAPVCALVVAVYEAQGWSC